MARWNWQAAAGTLGRLVAAAPEDAQAWSALGRARLMLGDPEGALDAWERAAEVAAARDDMWLFGAMVHEIGRYDPDRALALMDRIRRPRP
jgi:cytochrome c-type biogenesis protein CcmH/NrfG